MNLKVALLLAFIALLSSYSWAQSKTVTISGMVKDNISLAAFPFANVVLKKETSADFVAQTF